MPRALVILPFLLPLAAVSQEKGAPAAAVPDTDARQNGRRTELNLVGKTDTGAGESRRNENVYFNPIDNNALKELNVRLGATATIVTEFRPERGYFSAEFGNAPTAVLHVPWVAARPFHGSIFASHQNSVVSARSFFQVGDVRPAHDNNYGFAFGLPLWRGANLTLDASQQKTRGSVNGNVLVPRADERTPLTNDPATRAIVSRFLGAYPAELPNRTDIDPRALNTNAPQTINYDNAVARIDQQIGPRDRLVLRHQFTLQHVEAFQLVAGQNPNTDTRANTSRVTWERQWNPSTTTQFSAGFDRVGSLLVPEKNAVGPYVSISGLEGLGPLSTIPIDRAVNLFKYAALVRRNRGNHNLTAGFQLLRRQFNGTESDVHRGFFSFTNDFGRDAVTNLRLGTPTQTILAWGNHHRGFRNWDMQYFAGDNWKMRPDLTLHFGLRYQPVTRPVEVNNFNVIPYPCDCNNVAPFFGAAWRRGRSVLRAAASVQYGEIYPVTFQQVRFSPPWNNKVVVTAPSLVDPFSSLTQAGTAPDARVNLYVLDQHLATPYAYQYNASWEIHLPAGFALQTGYVGSRGHKALTMWYLNRAHVVPGVPQTTATINERRPIPGYAEIRLVLNGSRGYYDAARVSIAAPRWRGLSLDASYWFSKAMDLGSSYTNTAYEADSRLGRSQSEFYTHADLKALSEFDQPHAFLWRASYTWRGWTLSGVTLLKSGTPFNLITGSDAPGFGNVDGNGGDRPNIVDPSILGRTIANPDTSTKLLPRSAFSFMKPTDLAGNIGRNTFRKGGIRNINAALARTWPLGADKKLTARVESINLFNTPQFAAPGAELASPNFGVITNTLNDGRTFRLMVQLGF